MNSDSFLKNVSFIAGASIIGQSVGFLTAPVISRLFTPQDFGTYALVTSFTSLLIIFSTWRYEQAIILPEKDEDAAHILFGTLVLSLLQFIILCFLTASLSKLITNQTYKILVPFVWLIPFIVLLTSISNQLQLWLNRNQKFKSNAIVNIVTSTNARGLNIGGGAIGYRTTLMLILSDILSYGVDVLLRFIYGKNLFLFMKSWTPQKTFALLKRYYKFPLFDVWNAFLNALSLQFAPLLLAYFFTVKDVGYYSQGLRLIQLPMVLLGGAVGQVFYQHAAQAKYGGSLGDLFQSTFRTLFILGLYPSLIFMMWGKEIFTLFLGTNWTEAGVFAQILMPWCFFVLFCSPISTITFVLEKQGANLFFNISLIVFRFFALYLGSWTGNSKIALMFFSFSGVILYSLFMVYLIRLAKVKYIEMFSSFRNEFLLVFGFIIIMVPFYFINYIILKIALITLISFLYYLVFFIYSPIGKKMKEKVLVFLPRGSKSKFDN